MTRSFLAQMKLEIDSLIDKMKQAGLYLTVAGKLEDFLGVNIKEKQGEHGPEFHLTQPRLIESILQDLRLDGKKVKTKDTPMASSKLLRQHKKSKDFDEHFNYQRVIGKLNFLEQSTCGDITYATHMCACFCNSPKVEHDRGSEVVGMLLERNS